MAVQGVLKQVVDAVSDDKSGGKDKEGPIEPKDFTWDLFLKFLSSGILALTVISFTVEFFREGGVSCFHPPDTISLLPTSMDAIAVYEFARDQAMFLNKYCIGSIPITEYFQVYILVHGLLLVIPHLVWRAVFEGDFKSFFSIAGKNDRLRDASTGKYSEGNFDRVKKLEREYGGRRRRIFLTYVLKLVVQLAVCLGSIGVSTGWLKEFNFSFDCPRLLAKEGIVPAEWPLNVTVPCVYTSLRVFAVVRIADFILTGLACAVIIFALAWCFVRHSQQLGHHQVWSLNYCGTSECSGTSDKGPSEKGTDSLTRDTI